MRFLTITRKPILLSYVRSFPIVRFKTSEINTVTNTETKNVETSDSTPEETLKDQQSENTDNENSGSHSSRQTGQNKFKLDKAKFLKEFEEKIGGFLPSDRINEMTPEDNKRAEEILEKIQAHRRKMRGAREVDSDPVYKLWKQTSNIKSDRPSNKKSDKRSVKKSKADGTVDSRIDALKLIEQFNLDTFSPIMSEVLQNPDKHRNLTKFFTKIITELIHAKEEVAALQVRELIRSRKFKVKLPKAMNAFLNYTETYLVIINAFDIIELNKGDNQKKEFLDLMKTARPFLKSGCVIDPGRCKRMLKLAEEFGDKKSVDVLEAHIKMQLDANLEEKVKE